MTDKENDDDAIDSTAAKAEEIGKALGVEKDDLPADDLPDYDVVEGEDEAADERIAKEREPSAKKQLTNKEKREARKKRLADKFSEKDSIIERQAQKLEEFERWKGEVEGRLTNVDKAKIDEALSQTTIAFQQASAQHQEAFSEGDGQKATQALTVMYDAQRRIEQLQALKAQVDAAPEKPEKEAKRNEPDKVALRKAQAWSKKHSEWYKPQGVDEDSAIAKAVSAHLVNEGFDPRSDDFWDELDDRLAARGIGEYDEQEIPEKKAEKVDASPKRGAPPVGGSTNRNSDAAGKPRVTLSSKFVQNLKDSGVWDDPVRRNRAIKNHLEIRKQG